MNIKDLTERRYLKVSKWAKKRQKNLKEVLSLLDKYPEQVRMTQYHRDRVKIINEILKFEEDGKSKEIKALLETMMSEIFPLETNSQNREFFELKAAMLYNYVHKREVSHLS